MKRRSFLAATAASAGWMFGTPSGLEAAEGRRSNKDLVELRTYTFESVEKHKAFDKFLRSAAIPALGRLGVGPVGVFRLLKADNPSLNLEADSLDLHVLVTHKSPRSVLQLVSRLEQDPELLEAGRDILMAPKSDPAYQRFESSLFLAFDEAPHVEVPTRAEGRLFQLRIYESHSAERGLRKIEMFNEGGEIAIFRRCGMHPVFFGQALIGSRLPNLTYMLGFESAEAQEAAWGKFRTDPGWIALKDDEKYRDTVSRITNWILRPTEASQI